MSTTAFLADILRSEYERLGYSDYLKTNRQDTFFKHMYLYDDIAKSVSDDLIFGGYELDSAGGDDLFKSSFLLKYLNREIRYQTLDIFKAKLISKMRLYNRYLSEVYDSFDDIAQGKATASETVNGNSDSSQREASATLPQDQIDLDMESSVMAYADSTDYTRGRSSNSSNSSSVSSRIDVEDLMTVGNIYNNFVDSLDFLFLGVI